MSQWDSKRHSYEEIRAVVVDLLLRPQAPGEWTAFMQELTREMARRDGIRTDGPSMFGPQLHPHDSELARDAFWDLFRQGMITLGKDDSNPHWPWFRLSHHGQMELQNESPLRFYDSGSFIALVKSQASDISDDALVYLREAAGAFYAGFLL